MPWFRVHPIWLQCTIFNRATHLHLLLYFIHSGEMIKLLYRVANMDHSNSDCFALVVLSHGSEGTIYAHDAPFPTQRLWEPFTSDKAPTLAGKPKLFFFQACQGSQMDQGVKITRAKPTSATETDSFVCVLFFKLRFIPLLPEATASVESAMASVPAGAWKARHSSVKWTRPRTAWRC